MNNLFLSVHWVIPNDLLRECRRDKTVFLIPFNRRRERMSLQQTKKSSERIKVAEFARLWEINLKFLCFDASCKVVFRDFKASCLMLCLQQLEVNKQLQYKLYIQGNFSRSSRPSCIQQKLSNCCSNFSIFYSASIPFS